MIVFIILLSLAGTIMGEFLYKKNNIPFHNGKNYSNLENLQSYNAYILGDSRAEIGIKPGIINDSLNFFINIARPGGNIFQQVDNIKDFVKNGDKVIISITPAYLFSFSNSNFKRKRFVALKNFLKPYKYIDNKLDLLCYENLRISYGFNGFIDNILHKDVSSYYDEFGWHGITRYGFDEDYTELINIYTYKYKILENYMDTSYLSSKKKEFEMVLNELKRLKTKIILLRIPTGNKIKEIENSKYHWFNDYIINLCEEIQIEYLLFDQYTYNSINSDESHLNKSDAIRFSKVLKERLALLNM